MDVRKGWGGEKRWEGEEMVSGKWSMTGANGGAKGREVVDEE